MTAKLDRSRDITAFFAETLQAPYPFSSGGGVIARSIVGYALESQTKPMYSTSPSSTTATGPDLRTIAHEIAHQWFGNSVSPATWSDIWLNEGPAEWLSWWWAEHRNGAPTAAARFDDAYAGSMSWSIAPAAPPTAADIFNTDAMYTRGAMVLEALRQIMGDERFFPILRTWLTDHRHGAAGTADFVALVKRDSGEDPERLDAFFQQWLWTSYAAGDKPTITPSSFHG
jgi:aminopeptidase N